MNSIEIESQFTSGLYTKRPIAIVRGKGARLWDSEGREYIDCVGGQGAANIGHANPQVVQAIFEQAATLISCPEMFYNDRRAALEERLCRLTGLPRVFLCNSGTEAVEAAIKFSRLATGRQEIVACMRAFHGRTFGALSATWEKKYREPFEPLVPGFRHVPYNNLEALDAAVGPSTAAVILEVVQGEGGVNPASTEFLRGAQQLCRQRGSLLIIDEVQTGFGRTGRMFAFQHHNLQPDLLCLAKSIAGGIPMGAVLMGDRVGELPPQTHGSTFGGNPLACAASLATIDFIETNHLPERAAELGEWFLGALMRLESPLIRDVRGLGLMVGIELRQKVTPYLQSLMNEGILALPAGLTVIRFLPPLVIDKEDLEVVVEKTRKVLDA
ncbi:MAG TPA: aspartate aminotransferase family protein [Anaerolinea thermolimosa]|uniref:Putative [LysW]-aminoadipate semialdehyde transaminase n=1 Tax=Anaerolinea thermolimosa TaxID=229919 RepID=A0A3D1JG39_9CHLR|nr:aspartate aminotransferase family protein [Anaerolinea thermolimosa]GAP06937.1 acetylornithine aminotransferase apoenzyme [Anaerolinea thermolimosa]HCE17551.1 aspartate aminotransferase family protein [Anaerolinea thermolimosa]